jgi:hypothetical protein
MNRIISFWAPDLTEKFSQRKKACQKSWDSGPIYGSNIRQCSLFPFLEDG